MNGQEVKKMLVQCGVNLNDTMYFENDRKYTLDEIPNISIPKDILKSKLEERYGRDVSNYLQSIGEMDLKKILKLFPHENA